MPSLCNTRRNEAPQWVLRLISPRQPWAYLWLPQYLRPGSQGPRPYLGVIFSPQGILLPLRALTFSKYFIS